MLEVVVVSIPEIKAIYYLSTNCITFCVGDSVVFETNNGLFCGIVIKSNYMEKADNLILPLNNVLRIMSSDDLKKKKKNEIISEKALIDAKRFSCELGLDMNFIDSYLNFDGTQLILSFLSETRVDFRELAKKLAQKYKTRIELRQVGVRDKSKRIGGIGPCGLILCCNSFLNDFNSVSINMAKNQMLALNPNKINGNCGRLLCCLSYENETYTNLKKNLPKIGFNVDTSYGIGKVISIDILKNTYCVDLKDKGIVEFSGDSVCNGKN